jgi:hypothetical protein
MATPIYWNIYKAFNDPPGHQGLKCVKCRYATAGASTVVGLIGVYGVSRTMMANVYKGFAFVGLSIVGFGVATIALRMAAEDSKWNESKIQQAMDKLSKERKEFRESQMVNH